MRNGLRAQNYLKLDLWLQPTKSKNQCKGCINEIREGLEKEKRFYKVMVSVRIAEFWNS